MPGFHATLRFTALTTVLALLPLGAGAQATLTIDTQHVKGKVSPKLYGLMTEEINYSYEGGLYADLINIRTFRGGGWGDSHWLLRPMGDAEAKQTMQKTGGPSAALPDCMMLDVTKASATSLVGIANRGFWGIPVRPNTTYKGSFWAKADSSAVGPVHVRLTNNDTGKGPEAVTAALTTEWKQYDFTLKTSADHPANVENELLLAVGNPGKVWIDLVSLFPPTYKNRERGSRVDLMEKLAAMQPRFLRFPGGNYLEGDYINERFDWKKTIGPVVDRPGHRSPWNYHSTDQFGLQEFLNWCDDLKMQPLLAVFAGYALKHDYIKPGKDLEPYVQDALDEIEYVTGSTSTKWGAERAKNGHPEPYHLSYVEIGNEDEFDKSGSYDGRYAQFYKAIKAKYPELQLIATTPVKGIRPDMIDDHYYKKAEEFYAMDSHYDAMDRNGPQIFVGEWATREGGPTPNFGSALGDAAFMTSMERNSDLIKMASYAPLLTNVNPQGMQWESDLIGYDAMTSYGSPSYYAQVMFNQYLGDEILTGKAEGAGSRFFYSATRSSQTGIVHLKLVNGSSVAKTMTIALDGAKVTPAAKLITLSAKTLGATNTITTPKKIVPVESTFAKASGKFTYTVPAYSIQILELKTK